MQFEWETYDFRGNNPLASAPVFRDHCRYSLQSKQPRAGIRNLRHKFWRFAMHSNRLLALILALLANQLCAQSSFAHGLTGHVFQAGHNGGGSMSAMNGGSSSGGSAGRPPQSPTPLPWRGGSRPYNPPQAGIGPLYCIPNYQGDDRLNNHQGRNSNSGYDSSGIFYRPGGPIYGTDYVPPVSDYIPGQVTPGSGGWECSDSHELAGPTAEGIGHPGAGSQTMPPLNGLQHGAGMQNAAFRQAQGLSVSGAVLP